MSDIQQFRKQKDEYLRTAPESPIPHDQRADFGGLTYFPESSDFVFTVELRDADGTEVAVQTSDGQQRSYRRAKVATIEVDGEQTDVTLYDTGGHGYFVPFRDGTSGKETYGAGRYLDVHPNEDGTVTLDFNYAYNPYCAYDEAFSCPLPPMENWLKVAISAGETHIE